MASYHKHFKPDELSGICVVRRNGEKDEDFIKRFRKKYSKSGVAKELRERMYFEKPSDKRRRKKAQSIRAIKREEQKAEEQKERYQKIKAKRKKQAERARRNKTKGEKHAKSTNRSSVRQNRSRVSKEDD
jgi:small subunit ribosomal protein S21